MHGFELFVQPSLSPFLFLLFYRGKNNYSEIGGALKRVIPKCGGAQFKGLQGAAQAAAPERLQVRTVGTWSSPTLNHNAYFR